MNQEMSRRRFVQSGALIAAACAAPAAIPAFAEPKHAVFKPSPLQFGIATYTFRNFTRAQMLGFLKQLEVTSINCKDTKDHLPRIRWKKPRLLRITQQPEPRFTLPVPSISRRMKMMTFAQSLSTASAPASK